MASFLFKGDSRARLYEPHLVGRVTVVSFMTVAELERWALDRAWGAARRAEIEAVLQRCIVQESSRELCRVWAGVTHRARRRGRPIGVGDAWIAATALMYDLPLVTHNRRHYSGVEGLVVVSES